MAKRHCEQSLSRKWRENRIKLWNTHTKPQMSRAEIMKNVPKRVGMDQWAMYVEYRLREETQVCISIVVC